jgi:hypothetical protein
VKAVEDVVACVVDRRTFFPVAVRLARDLKKVYYCSPNASAFETVANALLGFNYPKIHGIQDFWPIKNEIDLFVFPDNHDWGLQLELESQGFPVWGSKQAEDLESLRGVWLETAKEIGLPMPHTEVVVGLDAAREYLYEHRDEKKHIKISRYRGDMETWCADDWMVTETKLDALAAKWGRLKNVITFYIQDDLNTDIEGGADSYFVGDFPEEVIIGYEKKNLGYFGAVTSRDEIAPEIWKPCELIAPVLRDYDYCNFFSTEVRLVDGDGYLLDPCCRCPTPAGEEQLEMFKNFGDIVWYGANGQLLQPEWAAKFCGEYVIQWTGEKEGPKSIRVPEEIRQWVKLFACAYVDDAFHFPPDQDPSCLGCIVGLGDEPEEVVDHLNLIREKLEDQPVSLPVEPMAEIIAQIEKAKGLGIEFGEAKEMPEPTVVLDG